MMFFRLYHLDCLSHASYLVGDTTTGRADRFGGYSAWVARATSTSGAR